MIDMKLNREWIFTAACLAVLIWGVFAHASTPAELPRVKAGPEAPAKKVNPAPTRLVKGRLFCSEYGTRYKEPVQAVFVNGDERYGAPISELDGAFQVDVPSGAAYKVRVEFMGKGFDAGTVEVPPGCTPFEKTIELYYPGSMLELVYDIRGGAKGGGVELKLK